MCLCSYAMPFPMIFLMVERDERSFAVVLIARSSLLIDASASGVVGEALSGFCTASASSMFLGGITVTLPLVIYAS